MKMCEKCDDQNCMYCDDAYAYMDYYIKGMQIETGIDYGDALEMVVEWGTQRIFKYNEEAIKKNAELIKRMEERNADKIQNQTK